MCKHCCGCLTEIDYRELIARELEVLAETIIKDDTGGLQQIAVVRTFVYGLANEIRAIPIANTVPIETMSVTLTDDEVR